MNSTEAVLVEQALQKTNADFSAEKQLIFKAACENFNAAVSVLNLINTEVAQEAFVRYVFGHFYNIEECLGTYQHLINEVEEV